MNASPVESPALIAAITRLIAAAAPSLSSGLCLRVRFDPLTVELGPMDPVAATVAAPAPAPPAPTVTVSAGLRLSPTEGRIVAALAAADGKPLIAKQIAAKIGEKYSGRLRTILNNMIERELIEHGEGGQGYLLAAGSQAEPASQSIRTFSAPEAAIVEAIAAEGRPLLGKVIARRAGIDYGPKLKILLANLVDRGALTHDEEGYGLATAEEVST